MDSIVSRITRSMVLRWRQALVVTSPATTARSVVTRVSHATRLFGSSLRQWSRIASLIWSATLSGCPIETDSLVNKYRSAFTIQPSQKGKVFDGVVLPETDYMGTTARHAIARTTGGETTALPEVCFIADVGRIPVQPRGGGTI